MKAGCRVLLMFQFSLLPLRHDAPLRYADARCFAASGDTQYFRHTPCRALRRAFAFRRRCYADSAICRLAAAAADTCLGCRCRHMPLTLMMPMLMPCFRCRCYAAAIITPLIYADRCRLPMLAAPLFFRYAMPRFSHARHAADAAAAHASSPSAFSTPASHAASPLMPPSAIYICINK